MSVFVFILGITTISGLQLMVFFRKRFSSYKKRILKKNKDEIESPTDKLLDKFIYDENKEILKEKLVKVSEIVNETQNEIEQKVKKKIKAAEAHYKFKHKELRQIRKAGKKYDAFSSKLDSAMPKTEKERQMDMMELKTAISILESLDESYYKDSTIKKDAATGMFYERMSRQFKSIILEHKLNNYILIPIQRLKYHAFQKIKHLKNDDILPILKIMKDTKMLKDIIEINPTFHVIVFNEEDFDLSLPEKVFLSFAYDEDLTLQKLIELTDWKDDYARKIIENLSNKGLVTVFDNKIIVGGFGQLKDRQDWNNAIEETIHIEEAIELEKKKRILERKQQLKKQLTKVENFKIQTTEPKAKEINEKNIIEETQEIKDKDALVGAMEALDDIMPSSSTEIDIEGQKSEGPSLEVLIPEKILEYHEKYTIITGGLAQYEKIKEYLDRELEEIPDNLLKTILDQLIELQMIINTMKIGKYEFYLFNEVSLSDSEKNFIKFAINKKPMKKEEFTYGLNWNEQKALSTMKKLQKKGIMMLAKHNVVIPGIIQYI